MKLNSTIGLADLVQALRWLSPQGQAVEHLAAMLGFNTFAKERADKALVGDRPTDSSDTPGIIDRGQFSGPGARVTGGEIPSDTSSLLRSQSEELSNEEQRLIIKKIARPRRRVPPPQVVRDAPALPESSMFLPPPAKVSFLLPEHLARSFIWQTLALPLPSDELDMEAIVEHLAKRILPVLRRVRRKGLRNGVQLLIDDGLAMKPFREDVRDLQRHIRKVVGPSWLGDYYFRCLPNQGVENESGEQFERYQPPSPGTTILLLTDLGIGRPSDWRSTVQQDWSAFVRKVANTGSRVVALLPYGPQRWPKMRQPGFHIKYWGTQSVFGPNVNTRDFARILAAASVLDRAIMREVRRKFFPCADAALEADLLLSQLVAVWNARVVTLRSDVLRELRDELAMRREERKKALAFLEGYRRASGTTQMLHFEESLVSAALVDSTSELEPLVARMLHAVVESDVNLGVARWALAVLNELSSRASDRPLCRQLRLAATLRLGISPDDLKGLPTEDSWILPHGTKIEVEWVAGNLILRDHSVRRGVSIRVPATVPRYVLIKPAAGHQVLARVWPGRGEYSVPCELPAELSDLAGASYRVSPLRNTIDEPQDTTPSDVLTHIPENHSDSISGVAWSPDQRYALSGSDDFTIRLWEVETGRAVRVFEGHTNAVRSVVFSPDGKHTLSGSDDFTIRLWEVETGRAVRVFEGHSNAVRNVVFSPDGKHALSGSDDQTVRLWDVESGRVLRVLEGHIGEVRSVVFSPDGKHALSGSDDQTVRLWDVESGRVLRTLRGHTSSVMSVAFSPDGTRVFSGAINGVWRSWSLVDAKSALDQDAEDVIQYTNAKVLLVGDTGSGKTGLASRLALRKWQPADSTVGAWATQWKLPVSSAGGVEREIWLWDYGGQADQRLTHQLYMEDTAVAVLVFDGQKEDFFETVGQWDRDLTRASLKPFTKLLVAGRVDAGGPRATRRQIEEFARERGFVRYLETSAKANVGCEELREAIVAGIPWSDIPRVSSPRLFKRLKEEVLRLKDEGRVLVRFNELRDTLRLRVTGEDVRFKEEELKAVVGLLSHPGVVWELAFGSWVLLQPEQLNAYAQAVIQTLREDEQERGAIPEEKVLGGELSYHFSARRLQGEEERFVLLAMHQTLVERGLCLREHTDKGPVLIFPSYYRRERPELAGHPAVLVSYRFNGFLDDIYATLVVRLHHARPFQRDQLWRYAADFKTLTGKQMGVKLTRRAEGVGELEVYFDPAIPMEEKIIFSSYVHEHLLQRAQNVVRLRQYVCPHCSTPVGDREIAMRKLESWLEKKTIGETMGSRLKGRLPMVKTPTIICVQCEKTVPLWDDLEKLFASSEVRQRVQELQQESIVVLDNESKERALVGEVISTVALAGQISREFSVSDHGIDMEIEFKNDAGEATGQRLYLQLKSGDSDLTRREHDGAEIFHVKNARWAEYWQQQAYPVMLVTRNSEGEIRWMDVTAFLRRAGGPLKEIVFEGEQFDVMSVRRWRHNMLSKASL